MLASKWVRGFLAGMVGGIVWLLGIFFIFGAAQVVLANPDIQSAKLIAAFTEEPLPRSASSPWVLPVGSIVMAALWGLVYVWISPAFSPSWWKRGLQFGGVAWVLMVPWFEFYIPWNVLLEPTALALLEMAAWAIVLLAVGLTVAGLEALLARRTV
ncbi:MAG: hypothetical protein R3335_02515 [Anaerolineales bacterium]|nr:hypothetical protein [Anaerolineales bacterium]